MKILALDIGDVWTGTALTDALCIVARPYKTIETVFLISFIQEIITQEPISTIIVGYPQTLRGTKSEQTKKVEQTKEQLQKQFPAITWKFWDERLSSKQAEQLKRAKTKEEKIASHSIAAAFILSSFLDYYKHTQETL